MSVSTVGLALNPLVSAKALRMLIMSVYRGVYNYYQCPPYAKSMGSVHLLPTIAWGK